MEDFDAAFDFIEKLWSYNTYDKDEIKDIYRQVIDDPACSVFFAVENGQYRGFCHCAFFHTFWLSGMTCYLSGIITVEDVRGKGYGVAIMDEVKRQAAERGCKGIVLDSGMREQRPTLFTKNTDSTRDATDSISYSDILLM